MFLIIWIKVIRVGIIFLLEVLIHTIKSQNEINPGVIEFIDVQEEDNCMIAILININ